MKAVTKKLSMEFSTKESRNLGALSKPEILLSPRVRTLCGSVPGTSRNQSWKTGTQVGIVFQNDLFPEVEFSARRTSSSVDSELKKTSHMVTRVPEEVPYCSLRPRQATEEGALHK